jgi:serine/threonine protein phosphatase 1
MIRDRANATVVQTPQPGDSTTMPTVAIGDIHGSLVALEDLLTKVAPELGPSDSLVFLGDYVDRGPESCGCLDRIIRLREESAFQVIALQGNHENWMLRSYRDHTSHSWLLGMESFETITSYSVEAASALRREAERVGPALITEGAPLPYEIFFDLLPSAHLQFLQNLALYHRTPDVVCVHGDFPSDLLVSSQTDFFPWAMDGFPDEYQGEESVVYGHWGNSVEDDNGWPLPCVKPNRTFGIDTIAKGVLTAMRFPDHKIFQSGRYQLNTFGV